LRFGARGSGIDGATFNNCSGTSKTILVSINNLVSNVTYGPNKKPLYEGKITAELYPKNNNAGTFGFRVTADRGNFFGFKQDVGSSLAIDSTNGPPPYGSALGDLKIPVGYCSTDLSDKTRSILTRIYDPDNFPASYAQNIGTNGAYVPLKFGIFQNEYLHVDGFPGQWDYFSSGRFIASRDDGSASVKLITSQIKNRSLPSVGASSLRIRDMGSGNYVVLGIFSLYNLFGVQQEAPLDEVYGRPDVNCDPPPCEILGNCPPVPETWRWKMNPSITGFNNQVTFTGQTPPKATYNNNLDGTVTSMGQIYEDKPTGEGNVTGGANTLAQPNVYAGKNYVDVNSSFTRNGAE
jgi:hypothetical protein